MTDVRGERLQIMLSPDELTLLDDFRFKHRRQRRAGLITGIAKQIELFAIGDSHDCSLGDQHDNS